MLPRANQTQTFAEFFQEIAKARDPKFIYQGKIVLPRVALAFGLMPKNNTITFEKQNFTGNFSSVMSYDPLTQLNCQFVSCAFNATDFSNSDLARSAFLLSFLQQVNFSKSDLSFTLINVDNSSATFDSANLSSSTHIASHPETNALWNNTSFRNTDLTNAVMNVNTSFANNTPDAILENCDFSLADLTNFTTLNLDIVTSLFLNVTARGFRAYNPTSTFSPKEIPSAVFFRCVFSGLFANINLSDRVMFIEGDFNHSLWKDGILNAIFDTGKYDHSLNPIYSTQNQTFFNATFDNMQANKSGILKNRFGRDLTYCREDVEAYLTGRGASLKDTRFGIPCSAPSAAFIIGIVTGFMLLSLTAACALYRRHHKNNFAAPKPNTKNIFTRVSNAIGTLYSAKRHSSTTMQPIPKETDALLNNKRGSYL